MRGQYCTDKSNKLPRNIVATDICNIQLLFQFSDMSNAKQEQAQEQRNWLT